MGFLDRFQQVFPEIFTAARYCDCKPLRRAHYIFGSRLCPARATTPVQISFVGVMTFDQLLNFVLHNTVGFISLVLNRIAHSCPVFRKVSSTFQYQSDATPK